MFAAIALLVLVTFVAFPTVLLILYPTKLFQKFVSCCGLQRWNALQHIFVDSFQGQYKDGTKGTCDFRMVSASFLILRILVVSVYTCKNYDLGITLLLQSDICAACFHAITRPYKTPYMNNVDILILTLLCLLLLLLYSLLYVSKRRYEYLYSNASTAVKCFPYHTDVLHLLQAGREDRYYNSMLESMHTYYQTNVSSQCKCGEHS